MMNLAPATLRGYRYDLHHFLAWHRTVEDAPFMLEGLAEYELISYRKHMVAGRPPAGYDQPPLGCAATPVPLGT